MDHLIVGDIACLNAPTMKDADFDVGNDWIAFLVTEVTDSGAKGYVVSQVETHRPNPIAVLLTDSRFDPSVERDSLVAGDQLVWIFTPVAVEFQGVRDAVKLERIGRVIPVVLEEIQRKIAERLDGRHEGPTEVVWEEHENVRGATEVALQDIQTVHG